MPIEAVSVFGHVPAVLTLKRLLEDKVLGVQFQVEVFYVLPHKPPVLCLVAAALILAPEPFKVDLGTPVSSWLLSDLFVIFLVSLGYGRYQVLK